MNRICENECLKVIEQINLSFSESFKAKEFTLINFICLVYCSRKEKIQNSSTLPTVQGEIVKELNESKGVG